MANFHRSDLRYVIVEGRRALGSGGRKNGDICLIKSKQIP